MNLAYALRLRNAELCVPMIEDLLKAMGDLNNKLMGGAFSY